MNKTIEKSQVKKITTAQFILVFSISIIVGLISILHVIVGLAKTPAGTIYLVTGHYYLDYFYYLQFIAQGLHGHWLPRQYCATDDPSIYFHLFPYVLMGQLGRLLHPSPILIYWISVFIMTVLLALLIFFVIREVLRESPFYLQFSAFLLTLSAAPFFTRMTDLLKLNIATFDYWSSYGTFFKRFEPVPHHLLAHFLTLTIFLLLVKFIKKPKKNLLITFKYAFSLSMLVSAELSFYPFQVVLIFFAVLVTTFLYFVLDLKKRQHRSAVFILIFMIIFALSIVGAGLIVKHYYDQTVFFKTTKGIESGWRSIIPLQLVILNFGPVFLLSIFGLKTFFKKINPMGFLLFVFVLVSLILFYSSLDLLLGTHNGRFLSPITYVLLGSLGSLGIFSVSLLFGRLHKFVFSILIVLFLVFSLPPNLQTFLNMLSDKNLNSPISYLPKGIIEGFQFLDRYPKRGDVLMTPSQFLGTVVPIFTDRHTYVARHSATPNYIEKNIRTSNFYLGRMQKQDAYSFLKNNNLAFVVLTSIEGYRAEPLYNYPFLKEIYKSENILIFNVD